MSGFRILDPFNTYFDLSGELASGGALHFYTAGTTTDADVFGDPALTVNNGPTITIGTDGRAVDDVWGDTAVSYRCRVYASDATLVQDVDNISAPGSGSGTLPAFVSGQFLTNNGTSALWAAIRQMLDPTGAANKIIGSDGTNALWVDKPADGANGADGSSAAVSATDAKTTIGDGTAGHDILMIQRGSGTAPATGIHSTSASITFPTAFKSPPFVQAVGRALVSGAIGVFATPTVISTTGASLTFSTNDDNSAAAVVNSMPFDWLAIGTLDG